MFKQIYHQPLDQRIVIRVTRDMRNTIIHKTEETKETMNHWIRRILAKELKIDLRRRSHSPR